MGLRERKKLATRVALRKAAFDLFAEHGYDATTTSQIAAAADVSPATFFRYFATKEALILEDDYDPLFLADTEPIDPSGNVPAQILRRAADLFDSLDEPTRSTETERARLVYSSPGLRAAQVTYQEKMLAAFVESVTRRATGPVDTAALEAAVGATFGAVMTFAGSPSGRWQLDSAALRRVADLFEAGLRVDRPA
ncbi:TetR/AcrR family transcriptional regulator [Gordonia phthalatica]|uniref:TetR/AcrR family transcriptional regulator n=1 Tax=Gordonia phthalatica TaxID=1136941 RepID=UPI0007858513|nr:TetR/AcrR family transcriptional regulator [Gordonia phthalatica]